MNPNQQKKSPGLEALMKVLSTRPHQTRQKIIDYLLRNHNPLFRTQVSMMNALGMSQATIVRYISELKGEGIVTEKAFGTAVIYQILYDRAIARGLAEEYVIFDLEYLKKVKGHDINGWTGKVYNFNDEIFITAGHESGFSMTIPIHDKDLKELVKAASLGLNFGILISAIAEHLESNR